MLNYVFKHLFSIIDSEKFGVLIINMLGTFNFARVIEHGTSNEFCLNKNRTSNYGKSYVDSRAYFLRM